MKIIKKITVDFNKANTNVVALEVRQGDTGGRYIQADLTVSKNLFEIPDGCKAVADATINEEVVVAENLPCVINEDKHSVLIPITEFMCVAHGNLKIVLKISKDNISVATQEIWVTVVRNIINDSTENLYKPIADTNAFLQRTTTGEFPETTGLEYERVNAVENGLEETKEKLTSKGVEVVEPFGVNDIPQAIENIEAGGEYKELYETEKLRADKAEVEAETEKARADKAESEVEEATAEIKGLENNITQLTNQNNSLQEENLQLETENTNLVANVSTLQTQNESLSAEVGSLQSKVTSLETNVINLIERDATEFAIPYGCTQIGHSAFRGCKLESIVIPNSVTFIDDYAFNSCNVLKYLNLPNSIRSTGYLALVGCTSLEFVTLENGFNCRLNISSSTKFSAETLVAMFEALADLTGQEAKTLTIGSTNLAKLTEEQIAIATNKNWTLA
jgi:hypothetical protein